MCSQYLVHHSFHSQTTSSGILDHEEARRKNVGGKLLGYVY
jgi:ribosomal protein S8